MIDFKKKVIRSSTGPQTIGGVKRKAEEVEYYRHRKAMDWMPEFRKFLAIKSKIDRHSTPHALYTECADWYKATGKSFKADDRHSENLLAWLKHLEEKGLL